MKPVKVATILLLGLWSCSKTEYVRVGPNWKAAEEMKAPEDTFEVKVTGTREVNLGETIRFDVKSATQGRLYIVQVDPQDRVDVLFPNARHKDNAIEANETLKIPPEDADWSVTAGEPAGPSMMLFVVTTGDLTLDEVLDRRKSDAKVLPKALRFMEKAPRWGLAKRVVTVQPK